MNTTDHPTYTHRFVITLHAADMPSAAVAAREMAESFASGFVPMAGQCPPNCGAGFRYDTLLVSASDLSPGPCVRTPGGDSQLRVAQGSTPRAVGTISAAGQAVRGWGVAIAMGLSLCLHAAWEWLAWRLGLRQGVPEDEGADHDAGVRQAAPVCHVCRVCGAHLEGPAAGVVRRDMICWDCHCLLRLSTCDDSVEVPGYVHASLSSAAAGLRPDGTACLTTPASLLATRGR